MSFKFEASLVLHVLVLIPSVFYFQNRANLLGTSHMVWKIT